MTIYMIIYMIIYMNIYDCRPPGPPLPIPKLSFGPPPVDPVDPVVLWIKPC